MKALKIILLSIACLCNKQAKSQCGDPRFSDLTGRFKADPITTVGIFPNPSTGEINIKSDFLLISTLEIYNTSSKKVLEIRVYQMQDKVDLSSLPDGTYMIKFTSYGYTIRKTVMLSHGVKSFSVFPNPTSGIINIQSETMLDTVLIYNNVGQLITKQILRENTGELDLSQQAAGVYLVKAQNQIIKLIKNKG
ncbi:MAG: T9SS type A sorting domain-containing protein [Bacteroidia bacterium]